MPDITVSWTYSGNQSDIAGFNVREGAPGDDFSVITPTAKAASERQHTLPNRAVGVPIRVEVKARDSAGNESAGLQEDIVLEVPDIDDLTLVQS